MNKKFLIWILIAIVAGLISGNILYKYYQREQNIDEDYNSYLLQLGVYDSLKEMQESVSGIESYMVIEKDNKYYVYLGISSKKDNAQKLATVFSEDNIDVAIKKTVIDNVEFISNLEQYDILLDSASTKDDIMSINEVILSSYEEMVLSH